MFQSPGGDLVLPNLSGFFALEAQEDLGFQSSEGDSMLPNGMEWDTVEVTAALFQSPEGDLILPNRDAGSGV